MSRACKSIINHQNLATAFFGGVDRGKVVQLHMNPGDLTERTLDLLVEDENSGIVETLGEWLQGRMPHRQDDPVRPKRRSEGRLGPD